MEISVKTEINDALYNRVPETREKVRKGLFDMLLKEALQKGVSIKPEDGLITTKRLPKTGCCDRLEVTLKIEIQEKDKKKK